MLKHIDRADDWIMRQTGDLEVLAGAVWESGVLDLMPPTIGPHRRCPRGRPRGAVLMRDVGEWMVPRQACAARPARAVPRSSGVVPRRPGDGGDSVGLLPLGNRYLFCSPSALAAEAGLGLPWPRSR